MVDNVEIAVSGGGGGNGGLSFHREKFAPRGGPDGGDGGTGGSVLLEADRNVDDLRRLKSRETYRAAAGEPGAGNRRSGRKGADLVLTVPVGTMVWDTSAGGRALIADLSDSGARVVVARGGKGGLGNAHFATPSRQAPAEYEEGTEGEERRLELELRLFSDVALIGPPSSGKSQLLGSVTRAAVTVGEYPFSTREPVIGIAEVGGKPVTILELPSLVAGSHLGRGLGNAFLRHAERAGALVYVVAGDAEGPVADFLAVREEVAAYDRELLEKPQVLAVNKMDLPQAGARVRELQGKAKAAGIEIYFISAQRGEGVAELLAAATHLRRAGANARSETAARSESEATVVLRPRPKARRK